MKVTNRGTTGEGLWKSKRTKLKASDLKVWMSLLEDGHHLEG